MNVPVKTVTDFARRFSGVTVIGDIHGDLAQMRHAVAQARTRGHGVLFLGDLINRGPDSLGCMRLAIDLIIRGRAEIIPGNHEVRARLIAENGEMTWKDRDRSKTLLAELDADPDGWRLLRAYLDLIADRPLWRTAGNFLFAHGAFPHGLRARAPMAFRDYVRGADPLADAAIDGMRGINGECTYTWLDELPAGFNAVIGHDPQPAMHIPVTRGGRGGAQLIHLDYGCGRDGGPIGTLEIESHRLVDAADASAA